MGAGRPPAGYCGLPVIARTRYLVFCLRGDFYWLSEDGERERAVASTTGRGRLSPRQGDWSSRWKDEFVRSREKWREDTREKRRKKKEKKEEKEEEEEGGGRRRSSRFGGQPGA